MTDIQRFNGFPPGKTQTIKVPMLFFSDLLGTIDDIVELKLTLYCFWALQQQEGQYRYVRLREVLRDTRFVEGIDADPDHASDLIREAFDRATARGTLLHVTVEGVDGAEQLYFMNTALGRNAIRAIEAGEFEPGDRDTPVALIHDRPTIFAVYEQNIGPLTPMIGEQLKAAEQEYPSMWITDAMQIAVERNKRSWKYVEAILKRWQTEGKDGGQSQRSTQADRYRYLEGEYSDYVDY